MESIGADRGWVHPLDIVKAFGVLGELRRNPHRTDLVGDFIGRLTGPSADRLFHKVWNDPVGRRMLQERRETLGPAERFQVQSIERLENVL